MQPQHATMSLPTGDVPAGRRRRLTLAGAPWLVLTIVSLVFLWPALVHAFEVWSTTEEFGYGFAVPLVSLGLIWLRRAELRRQVGRGAGAGLAVVAVAATTYVLGQRVGINVITGLSVAPLLWGMAVYLWGWGVGRVLAFPLGYLTFGFGLYRGLLGTAGFALQEITSRGAGLLAGLLGLGVVRDGLVLRSDRFAFIVAEACSGMSSLLSLLALGALWLFLARGRLGARLIVLASVAPLVIAANVVRVTLVLVVASWLGQEAAMGFFHGASSLVLFGFAVTGLVVISWRAGCRAPRLAF